MEQLVSEAPGEGLQHGGGVLAGLEVPERPLQLQAARFFGGMAEAVGRHAAMKPQRAERALMQIKSPCRPLPRMAP